MIDSINIGETIHLLIPVMVQYSPAGTTYVNTANIKTMADESYEKKSESNYHDINFDTGSLTVRKTVDGNAGSKDKEFEFSIILGNFTIGDKTFNASDINGNYGDMNFENGIGTFTLADGETITATNLPNGITYTVKEMDYTADGYVTTYTGETGTIVGDDMVLAEFINTRDVSSEIESHERPSNNSGESNMPKTGYNQINSLVRIGLFFFALVLVILLIADFVLRKKYYRKRNDK